MRKPYKPLIQIVEWFNEIYALTSNSQKEEIMYKIFNGSHTSRPHIDNK